MPETALNLCFRHIGNNVTDNLKATLKEHWPPFQDAFYKAARATSPAHFEFRWKRLLDAYPQAADYLTTVLYPKREKWAWPWTGMMFCGGMSTTARNEAENRITKALLGPKATAIETFEILNCRTQSQAEKSLRQTRDVGLGLSLRTLTY